MLLCGFVEQKLSFSALVDRNIIDFIIHFAVYVDHLDKSQVQALGALGLGHNHCGFPNCKSILVYAGFKPILLKTLYFYSCHGQT